MLWSIGQLADSISEGLQRCANADDLGQVVYGFDAQDELGLHPLIQASLRDGGYGVWPEQRYPGDGCKSRKSEGKRCDIVLTEGFGDDGEALPLRDPELRGTLFDDQPAVDVEDAYWLEIKTVAQHETSGPFVRYSSELLSAVAGDIKKLWNDGVITHAGLGIVLFTESKEIAEHDLMIWHEKCLDRGYPVGGSALRHFPITNRIGNGSCTVGVFGVRGL